MLLKQIICYRLHLLNFFDMKKSQKSWMDFAQAFLESVNTRKQEIESFEIRQKMSTFYDTTTTAILAIFLSTT